MWLLRMFFCYLVHLSSAIGVDSIYYNHVQPQVFCRRHHGFAKRNKPTPHLVIRDVRTMKHDIRFLGSNDNIIRPKCISHCDLQVIWRSQLYRKLLQFLTGAPKCNRRNSSFNQFLRNCCTCSTCGSNNNSFFIVDRPLSSI